MINRKITALCNRNSSAVLTYIHTHRSNCQLESEDDRHIHTPIPILDLACSNTHTFRGRLFSAISGAPPLHSHTSTCLLEIWLRMTVTHTRTHPYPHLIACTNTHFFSTVIGAFSLHACSVTHPTWVLISPVWDESS